MEDDKKFEGMYFTKPTPTARLYHIFGKDDRSLCGKYMMLRKDSDLCTDVKGTETFGKEDCKVCFKKAGLILPDSPYTLKSGVSSETIL